MFSFNYCHHFLYFQSLKTHLTAKGLGILKPNANLTNYALECSMGPHPGILYARDKKNTGVYMDAVQLSIDLSAEMKCCCLKVGKLV